MSQNQAKASYKDFSGNRDSFVGKPGFFCQRHEVACINFGEIPNRPVI